MNARNKFLIVLAVILAAATSYYFVSTPRSSDLVMIGTVDSNQIIVSPQMQGRIAKLLVDEGTQVKQGDLIAILDPSELEAEARAAAAMIDSLRSQVSATQATSTATHGSTSSNVVNAQSRLQSARAQLLQAEAMLQRTESDSRRMIELAKQGVASDQDRVQAESNLKGQLATVQSLKDQVSAAEADLNTALANTNQAHAAASTVQSTRGQLANAEAQLKEAEVRLGYTKIYAPLNGTVSVRAAIPETESDHIGLGDTLRIRLPGGTITSGKVFFKAPEADFATQRDVSRRKRDIRTIVLKVRLDNPKDAYVPGMTAEVLVSQDQLKASAANTGSGVEKQQ